MKSIEQKRITNRCRCGNQSQIVEALLKKHSANLWANECFHHETYRVTTKKPVFEMWRARSRSDFEMNRITLPMFAPSSLQRNDAHHQQSCRLSQAPAVAKQTNPHSRIAKR